MCSQLLCRYTECLFSKTPYMCFEILEFLNKIGCLD